jgi:hypothetical protein
MLACLDAEFADLAAAFVRGDYVLWLGSGLSSEVVPDLPSLLQNLLSHLQARVDVTDDDCRFARALNEVLGISGLPAEHRAEIDISTEVTT